MTFSSLPGSSFSQIRATRSGSSSRCRSTQFTAVAPNKNMNPLTPRFRQVVQKRKSSIVTRRKDIFNKSTQISFHRKLIGTSFVYRDATLMLQTIAVYQKWNIGKGEEMEESTVDGNKRRFNKPQLMTKQIKRKKRILNSLKNN